MRCKRHVTDAGLEKLYPIKSLRQIDLGAPKSLPKELKPAQIPKAVAPCEWRINSVEAFWFLTDGWKLFIIDALATR
jgi:hypothetical protein